VKPRRSGGLPGWTDAPGEADCRVHPAHGLVVGGAAEVFRLRSGVTPCSCHRYELGDAPTIGPFEPSPASREEIERLAEACTRAGLPTAAVDDARGPQWRKVIFNAATNPVGALTGLTHGRVCEIPALRRLVSGLVDEGKAVAEAQGIVLDADPEELIDHAAKPEVAYDHKASMLQDVEAHRPTEIDYLNGGIVRFGGEHGVPAPLNRAVWALVKGLERSW